MSNFEVSNTWLSFCSFKKGDVIEILSEGVDPVCVCVYIGLLFSSCLCTWPYGGTQLAHYYQEEKHVIQLTNHHRLWDGTTTGMVAWVLERQDWCFAKHTCHGHITRNTHDQVGDALNQKKRPRKSEQEKASKELDGEKRAKNSREGEKRAKKAASRRTFWIMWQMIVNEATQHVPEAVKKAARKRQCCSCCC